MDSFNSFMTESISSDIESVKEEMVPSDLKQLFVENACSDPENMYSKNCNEFLLKKEWLESLELKESTEFNFLYPTLNDPNFNVKISQKKEFKDTKFDGSIYDIEKHAEILSKKEFEISPHQVFIKNFLSFETPYNSLLLYHGLGTGKTCSSIGVCEEYRDYMKQMGIQKKIIIVASPNVQDNFRLQLFNENKLQLIDGIWNIRSCIGNKLLKEINPTNIKGLSKEKVISQVKNIIKTYYLFLGYIEFSNYIEKKKHVNIDLDKKTILKLERKKLQTEFNGRLIVIDEAHNIRDNSSNSENKKVSSNLFYLIRNTYNIKLLLLTATPMYNSYSEIIWLLKLMNMNDKRAIVNKKDIFDNKGNFKENGKELLIFKSTGYISFVKGEDPYTFPFSMYPSLFSPENTFIHFPYPTYQMNGLKILDKKKIKKLNLFLTEIGDYQQFGYSYIIHSMKDTLLSQKSFNYDILKPFIECLNIVYPIPQLDELVPTLSPIPYSTAFISDEDTDDESDEEESVEEESEETEETEEEESDEEESDEEESDEEESDEEESDEEEESEKEKSEEEEESEEDESQEQRGITIIKNEITGKKGLENIMIYNSTPRSYEYKESTLRDYGRIFQQDKIGLYSNKIKNICDCIYNPQTNQVGEGIILIYSQYLDSGLIPVALALEEMGIKRYKNPGLLINAPKSVDSLTFQTKEKQKGKFKEATYIMITGNKLLSPDNNKDINVATSSTNKEGTIIKVVLISRAGSEGIDLKNIRQVHILDPWYNMSRNDQIIGRGIRNYSHIQLPFIKRNVQVFLYATILKNKQDEAADLYTYRMAESKAIKIGRVSRVLKENSVDCIINHEQNNYTQDKIKEILKKPIEQILSTGQIISDYYVGITSNSPLCDYMEDCNVHCHRPNPVVFDKSTYNTYNNYFILSNSEKLIQKIKLLFQEKFFYSKKSLLQKLNHPKPYPLIQIYSALTYLIEDSTEFLKDMFDRSGRLINIGDYYLFQPLELTDLHISILDRSIPIPFKHSKINIPLNEEYKEIFEKKINIVLSKQQEEENKIYISIKEKYEMVILYSTTEKVLKRDENWEKHCGFIIQLIHEEQKIPLPTLYSFAVYHFIESLLNQEKLDLYNYIYSLTEYDELQTIIRDYIDSQILLFKKKNGLILFNGKELLYYILQKQQWVEADEIDIIEMNAQLEAFLLANDSFAEYVGYLAYDKTNQYLIFKVKNMAKKRNTGARCDEANKKNTIKLLNTILDTEKYTKENTKQFNNMDLCIEQEFSLRYFNSIKKNGSIWFLTPEYVKLYNL